MPTPGKRNGEYTKPQPRCNNYFTGFSVATGRLHRLSSAIPCCRGVLNCSLRRQIPEQVVSMPTHKPGQIEDRQDGLALANALRDCLVSGLALFDPHESSLAFNREAEEMLGLPSSAGQPIALDLLPTPM